MSQDLPTGDFQWEKSENFPIYGLDYISEDSLIKYDKFYSINNYIERLNKEGRGCFFEVDLEYAPSGSPSLPI